MNWLLLINKSFQKFNTSSELRFNMKMSICIPLGAKSYIHKVGSNPMFRKLITKKIDCLKLTNSCSAQVWFVGGGSSIHHQFGSMGMKEINDNNNNNFKCTQDAQTMNEGKYPHSNMLQLKPTIHASGYLWVKQLQQLSRNGILE
jgi:hypothetical protein